MHVCVLCISIVYVCVNVQYVHVCICINQFVHCRLSLSECVFQVLHCTCVIKYIRALLYLCSICVHVCVLIIRYLPGTVGLKLTSLFAA